MRTAPPQRRAVPGAAAAACSAPRGAAPRRSAVSEGCAHAGAGSLSVAGAACSLNDARPRASVEGEHGHRRG